MTDRDKSNDDDVSAARILGLPANRDDLYPLEHPRVRLANSVRACSAA